MYLSVGDLARLQLPGLPSTAHGIHHRARAEGWPWRPRSGKGGGREYPVQALPAAAQALVCANYAGQVKPAVQALLAGAEAQRRKTLHRAAEALSRSSVALADDGVFDPARNPKLDLIQRLRGYHALRGGALWASIQEFCALWNRGLIEALPGTLAAYPVAQPKTLDKYERALRMHGVEALLERKPRKDKGQSALMRDPDLYNAFIAALAEMHDPTARQVQRVLRVQLGNERTPSTGTLSRWLKDFKANNAPALLMFKNPDSYKNRYRAAFGTQADGITRPNQQWQQDSTIGDAQQRVEMAFNIADQSTGEIRRHAIICCVDVFTRRAQVLVTRTSNSNGVKAITRRSIQAWGKPEQIKTDNGKDYTAQDFDFALDSLNIEHLLCTPFSPEQKPYVERFIGTLMHDLFPMLEGFVGHSVAERKAIESARSFAQRFGHNGVDLHMSATQLQGVIDGWLDEYHNRVHSTLNCSPNEMAARHVNHIIRLDDRALDLFLMPVAGKGIRQVTKRGISLDKNWFAAPELAAHIGASVRCRQDEADLGALHIFTMNGTYICRAVDHTLLGINRAELAAKARAIETATIKPLVDEFRAAKKKGLTRQAVHAIFTEREARAAEQASNVHRIPPRVVQHTTDAIDSVVASFDTTAQDAARMSARATLEEAPQAAAPVKELSTPNARYSAWVRLSARMQRNELISEREQQWARSYESSSEFDAWHALHEGSDPLADVFTKATG